MRNQEEINKDSVKVGIVIQARMTSTRLPGKVLQAVLDKPLLEYQIERLSRVCSVHEIIVATTVNETDRPIIEWCDRHKIKYFRGSEHDVLARYYFAAKDYGLDIIIRITGDCPLIDPAVVERAIQLYLENPECDYVTNGQKRTYPRGMDVEVFSMDTLTKAFHEAETAAEREHVTPFIYGHPERYVLMDMLLETDESGHRWTVDTEEDFELVARLIQSLYPDNPEFTLEDMLGLISRHPEWSEINAHIKQKKLGE